MTTFAASVLAVSLAAVAAADDRIAEIIAAPDAPVRLDSTKVLNTGAQPLVLLYAATNAGDTAVEQFTVMVFVYSADGQLKARQVAPGRRDLPGRATKYSTMVLDVGTIEPTDTLMAGVDQVQHAGSENWWRTELRVIAQAAADAKRGAAKTPRN